LTANIEQWYDDEKGYRDYDKYPILLELTEAEMFQLSVVWDYNIDYNILLELQRYALERKGAWHIGFTEEPITLEY
jgi:hypothetical protein